MVRTLCFFSMSCLFACFSNSRSCVCCAGMHPYFRVFHSGINVGAEAGYMIAMVVFLKLSHAFLFSYLAKQAKTVTPPM